MRIAINFRNTYNNDRALRMFTDAFWTETAKLKQNNEFLFITAKEPPADWRSENIQIQKLKAANIKWIDKKRLNNVLAGWQPDCFIDTHETGFIIHSLPGKKEKKAGTEKAAVKIDFITNGDGQPDNKKPSAGEIILIKPAFKTAITSLTWTESESIKTQYTGGRSFFLFSGNISEQHQLVELLKAFSLFKKWQQSNMQLVIAGYTTAFTPVLEEKLLTYKYKADVVIVKNSSGAEIAKLLAACYAVVYPATENIFPLALLRAVQSHKAIIASDTYFNRQIIQQAEWVNKNETAEGFAKAMILLYKDEKHQQALAQHAVEAAQQINRRQMLTEVWQCIEK